MNKDQSVMNLKVEDTVVVNVAEKNVLIVSFLEAIYDDEKNTVQAQAGVDKCYSIIEEKKLPTPVSIIVDLRPLGNNSHISPKARGVYMKFVSDPRVGKVAVLGSSDAQVSIANFVLSLNSEMGKKLSWFSNESEAKYWILQ